MGRDRVIPVDIDKKTILALNVYITDLDSNDLRKSIGPILMSERLTDGE